MDFALLELYHAGLMVAIVMDVHRAVFNLAFTWFCGGSFWFCLCLICFVCWFFCIEILYGRSEISETGCTAVICIEWWSWAASCRLLSRRGTLCILHYYTTFLLCTWYITIATLCFWFFIFCKARRRPYFNLLLRCSWSLTYLKIWNRTTWLAFFAGTGAAGSTIIHITHV